MELIVRFFCEEFTPKCDYLPTAAIQSKTVIQNIANCFSLKTFFCNIWSGFKSAKLEIKKGLETFISSKR